MGSSSLFQLWSLAKPHLWGPHPMSGTKQLVSSIPWPWDAKIALKEELAEPELR